MKKLIVSIFIIVTSLSFRDSDDDKRKTYLIVEYDNGTQTKILMDKDKIKTYNKDILWHVVEQALTNKDNK